MNVITRFMDDESGASAIEYGIIAALIAVGIIAAATTLDYGLRNLFNSMGVSNEATTVSEPADPAS